MEFTREPIIETIITPKEGYKLAVRRSAQEDQEDYLVDAVEIVSFGSALFFRSLERPKAFLLPVSDYEVLEVRETRMVLKTPSIDRSIKIGGGREPAAVKHQREIEKHEEVKKEEHRSDESLLPGQTKEGDEEAQVEPRLEKKRERRRQSRKRRGRDEPQKELEGEGALQSADEFTKGESQALSLLAENEALPIPQHSPAHYSALLQPPPTLISETIDRYRQNEAFKGAFYLTEEEQYKPHEKVAQILNEEDEESFIPSQDSFLDSQEEIAQEHAEVIHDHFPTSELPFQEESLALHSSQPHHEEGVDFHSKSVADVALPLHEEISALPLYVKEEQSTHDEGLKMETSKVEFSSEGIAVEPPQQSQT